MRRCGLLVPMTLAACVFAAEAGAVTPPTTDINLWPLLVVEKDASGSDVRFPDSLGPIHE